MIIKKTLISAFVAMSVMWCFSDDSDVQQVDTDIQQIQLKALSERQAVAESDIESVQSEMREISKAFTKFKHEKVYGSGKAAAIHKDMVKLERQLVEKRKLLEEEIMKHPEMQEFVKKRNWLYEKKKGLIDRKIMLANEIKALRYKMGEKDAAEEKTE